ncbi:MAG: hypothetical protein MUP86_02300 [Dehalococcoidia bacterium]|nr:hypothetical protein [Dehalococcoidia bacterium]
MSMSNDTENATLKMHLQGVDPSYRSGASQFLGLLSLADPDEAAPIASELTYSGYGRVTLTKATAWTDGGSSFTNAALVQFGKRTDDGATQTARSFVVVDTASGAVSQAIIGLLDDELDINKNVQPQFGTGDMEITAQ